jgi:hypothetical protein
MTTFWMNRLAACMLLTAFACVSQGVFATDTAQSKQQEEEWRADRTTALLAPDGSFSLIALDWLRQGKTTVGTANDNTIQLTGNAAAHAAIFDLEGSRLSCYHRRVDFPAGLTVKGGTDATESIQQRRYGFRSQLRGDGNPASFSGF